MKTLIIVGSSKEAREEFVEACRMTMPPYKGYLPPEADIMAVNLAMMGLQWMHTTGKIHVKHWVSLHPELFHTFTDLDTPPITHSNNPGPRVQKLWSFNNDGLSGLFALKVALGMKEYDRIIITGCATDKSGHFYDFYEPPFEYLYGDPAVLLAWREFAAGHPERNNVRAMSGLPLELFGRPTPEWIKGAEL